MLSDDRQCRSAEIQRRMSLVSKPVTSVRSPPYSSRRHSSAEHGTTLRAQFCSTIKHLRSRETHQSRAPARHHSPPSHTSNCTSRPTIRPAPRSGAPACPRSSRGRRAVVPVSRHRSSDLNPPGLGGRGRLVPPAAGEPLASNVRGTGGCRTVGRIAPPDGATRLARHPGDGSHR